MGRFKRSIALARSSYGLLRADKELLVLPILSFAATLVVMASFAAPVIASAEGRTVAGDTIADPGPTTWLLLLVAYFVLAYVMVFFNTAIVCAADERMRGGDPTVRSAIAGAARHAGRILPWALLSATVSVLLRAVEERVGLLGRLAVAMAGVAWSLATFLVLPVIVIEGLGALAAVKRSGALIKQAWGEQVITNGAIGIVGILAILAGLPLLLLAATGVGVLAVLGVGLFVLWFAAVSCVVATLSGIFQTALYHYAANGMPPAAFAEADLAGAFGPRG